MLFTLVPAMVIVLGLAWAYVRYRATPTGGGILYGVEPVVVAVVAVALWGLAGTALRSRWYAILGFTVQTVVTSVSFKGPMWGNFRFGAPAGSAFLNTDNYFLQLQQQMSVEQEAFQAVSAVVKSRHDSAMDAIRNIN